MRGAINRLRDSLLNQATLHEAAAEEGGRFALTLRADPDFADLVPFAEKIGRQQTIRAMECRANAHALTATRDTDAFPEQP